MTAKELIKVLSKIPVLDVELKLHTGYSDENGFTNTDLTIIGVSSSGVLQTEELCSECTKYLYIEPEDSQSYNWESEYLDKDECPLTWYNQGFDNEEEYEGYLEYQRVLRKQDRDLQRLVKRAHQNALNTQLDELNNELDKLF